MRLFRMILLMAMCVGVASSMAVAQDAGDNPELARIYRADQADRDFATRKPSEWKAADWVAISKRDKERRARVTVLLGEGKVQTALDYYNAAMVFQHGDGPADILQAHVLSSVAAMKGHNPARWLAAASLDRYLQRIGQPQIFGTQYRNADPKQALSGWSMDPYDKTLPPCIRKEYGVPTLEETVKRLEGLRGDRPLTPSAPKP